MIGQMGLAVLATLPILIAGVSLIGESGGGLYWLLAGIIGAIVGLAPQSLTALGIELLGVGVGCLLAVPALFRKSFDPAHQSRSQMIGQMALAVLATLPILIAGVSLIAESGGGLYWVLAGIIGAIVGSGANAWVLLVEILR
jgi:hypothetical protein